MMTKEEKMAYVNRIFNLACAKGICKTKAEFARMLDINPTTLSGAMGSRPENLTDKLVGRVVMFSASNNLESDHEEEKPESESVLVTSPGVSITLLLSDSSDTGDMLLALHRLFPE